MKNIEKYDYERTRQRLSTKTVLQKKEEERNGMKVTWSQSRIDCHWLQQRLLIRWHRRL
jgi:hypothetical protein